MASFVENTQHKVERKAFEIMTNSIVGKLTKTDDIAKRQETVFWMRQIQIMLRNSF